MTAKAARVRAAFAAAAVAVVAPLVAQAGGLQLPTRGVRATARGGAFVAGADDLGALWFNPAGLAAHAGGEHDRAALVDVSYVRQESSYRRIDSGNNPRPEVDNAAPGVPIPTIAGAVDGGDGEVWSAGIYAPYASLGKYPQEGPQRYSLVDMSQSVLAIVEVAYARQLTPKLRVGGGLQNMFMSLSSTIVFSGCPAETTCAPEDPEFDALGQVRQNDYVNPSAVGGIQYQLSDSWRLGAALQLPFYVSGEGSFKTRLPPSGFFDNAEISGDRASITFWMPPMVRAGVEYRHEDRLRAELAIDVEFWAVHDSFDVEPKGVEIRNAAGVGTYEIGEMSIPRNFDNTIALELGVEGKPLAGAPLSLMAGYAYETAAAPDAYLSVLTVDGDKQLVSGGASYRIGDVGVYGTVGYVAVADREVTADEGLSPQLSPIREGEYDTPVYVNWGEYSSSWLMAGAGVTASF